MINNYPIEPEMYIETPGDLRQEKQAAAEAQARKIQEVNQTDEQGKLTIEGDKRGKGVSMI